MCFILIAVDSHRDLPLLVAANRDEFHARPAASAAWWPGSPPILAGRDRQAGGAWFGVRNDGRFAAVTNLHASGELRAERVSRGALVVDALRHGGTPGAFIDRLMARGDLYNPFNLVYGDPGELYYVNNRTNPRPRRLDRGIFALANAELDAPWPKLVEGRRQLSTLLRRDHLDSTDLFALLADRRTYPDPESPASGLPTHGERALSAIFIDGSDYGTRCSTIFTISSDGNAYFEERHHAGRFSGRDRSIFSFRVAPQSRLPGTDELPSESQPTPKWKLRDANQDE